MILNFQNVTYQIPNGQVIYQNLNLKFFKGDFFGVLGKNGAGKSTLIEMVMGLRKLKSGKITAFNEDVTNSSRHQKNKIFVVTHDMNIPGYIVVKDLLEYYQFFYPNYSKEIEKQLLELFDIDPKKKFGGLSTGQKIKALLCAAFASRSELYLFDEVTAVLDPKSRRNFFQFLRQFRVYHSCSMLLATNISEDLENSVDKVIFITDEHKVVIRDIDQIDSLFEEDISA
jgi:ABC-type multidrug transport system ATPase subunit